MLDCVAILAKTKRWKTQPLAYPSLEVTEMLLLLNYTHYVWVVDYLVIVVEKRAGWVTLPSNSFVLSLDNIVSNAC